MSFLSSKGAAMRRYNNSNVAHSMAYLAIDPGLTSGWFYYDRDGEWEAGEAGFEKMTEIMNQCVDICRTFIIERYVITPETAKLSRQSEALEIIGVARFLAPELILQTPADAKRMATDLRLKDIGWWTKGKGHANDAARHMFLYGVKQGWITFDKDGRPEQSGNR